MVILLYDPKTGERIYCFWNPRARRRYCFAFAFIDRLFRIRRLVRRLWICSTATFTSVSLRRHFTKNLYVESQCCSYLDFERYSAIRLDAVFMRLLESIANRLDECHKRCEDKFWGSVGLEKKIAEIPENIRALRWFFEIAGVEFSSIEGKTYCCFARPHAKGETLEESAKCKCIEIDMEGIAPSVILPNCRRAT